jgi:hypothetical protein
VAPVRTSEKSASTVWVRVPVRALAVVRCGAWVASPLVADSPHQPAAAASATTVPVAAATRNRRRRGRLAAALIGRSQP